MGDPYRPDVQSTHTLLVLASYVGILLTGLKLVAVLAGGCWHCDRSADWRECAGWHSSEARLREDDSEQPAAP